MGMKITANDSDTKIEVDDQGNVYIKGSVSAK